MQVREDYKQTEVVVIPEDWNVKRLGDVLHIRHGKSQHHIVANNGQYPILATGGEIGRTNAYLYDKPSVLIGRKGTIDKPRYQDTPFWTVDTLFYTELSNAANPKFIYFKFQMIDWRSYNEASGVPSLNASTIENIEISIPGYVEQRAIATALSDVDALLVAQDKLIAKKRDIKQAAMQLLLTGMQRLPGFTGEWVLKRLGDVGEIVTGSTPPTEIKEYWNGSIPWITPTDISDKKDMFSSEREITLLGLQAIRNLPANSLLVTCIASIGKNAILRNKGACNQQINAIIPNDNNSVEFLYYLVENSKSYLLGNAGITATLMISKKDFSEISFSFPPIAEQTAIATILSDMDADLTALEQQRDKTRDIKQGMMQELLTGRIRLV